MHRDYDGIDYHHSSDDSDKSKGVGIIANILGAAPSLDGLEYSMDLYAGGTGVADSIGFRFKHDPASWPATRQKLRLKRPDEAIHSADWSESIGGLIGWSETANDLASDVRRFIEKRKLPFQDATVDWTTVEFAEESDVNSWCVFWKAGDWLNCLSFDQG